jgi:hypothetical protein
VISKLYKQFGCNTKHEAKYCTYSKAKSKINGAKIIKPTARLPPVYINGFSRSNKWRPTAAYDFQLI